MNTDITNRDLLIVEGVIMLGQNNSVILLENPDSRSCITYNIEGKLVDKISNQLSKNITILGYINNKKDQRWNRWIRVVAYIE